MKSQTLQRTIGLVYCIGFSFAGQASDYYVTSTAGLDGPGRGSQSLPWKTINYALDHISGSSGNPHRVLVAQGVYVENVVCDPYESICGGHNPSTWVRDPNAYPTAINGNNLDACVILGDGCTVDGFTLSNGKRDYGAGVSCSRISGIISNCRITFNTANINGSAIYINGGAVQVISNSITFNTRNAICVTSSGSLIARDNVLCDTINGGGIYSDGATLSFLRDRLLRNAEEGIEGYSSTYRMAECIVGDHNSHAGIYLYGSVLEIADSLIAGNHDESNGGGIHAANAGVTITRSIICRNSSGWRGGGIMTSLVGGGWSFEMKDCVCVGNRGGWNEGFRFVLSPTVLKNNFFVNNKRLLFDFTGYSGVCLTSVNNSVLQNAGGLASSYLGAGAVAMINDLLWGNGDDLNFTGSGATPVITQQAITYCDVEDGDLNGVNGNISVNPDFIGQVASGTINSLTYDAQRCRSVVTDNAATFQPGALARTFFWAGTNAFYIETNSTRQVTVYGDLTKVASVGNAYTVQDYHLAGGSLCIDAGTPTSTLNHDFEGDSRPNNGGLSFQVDIGADEYVSPPLTLSLGRKTNAQAVLTVSGPVGANVTLESATNLAYPACWMPITNLVLPLTPYNLLELEVNVTNPSQRFFRAFR